MPIACATTDEWYRKVGVTTLVAHGDPLGLRAKRSQSGERKRRVAASMPPRLEVVADDNAVKADLLLWTLKSSGSAGPHCSADAL